MEIAAPGNICPSGTGKVMMTASRRQIAPIGAIVQSPASQLTRGRAINSRRCRLGRARSTSAMNSARAMDLRASRAGIQMCRRPSKSCADITMSGTPNTTAMPGRGTGSISGTANTRSRPPTERRPTKLTMVETSTCSVLRPCANALNRSESRAVRSAAGSQPCSSRPTMRSGRRAVQSVPEERKGGAHGIANHAGQPDQSGRPSHVESFDHPHRPDEM